MQSAAAYSIQMDPIPVRVATVRNARKSARAAFAMSMSRRRSSRSASAPAVRAKRSQGRVKANVRPAMRAGESVYRTATSGSATFITPSARLERLADVHSFA